MKITETDTWAPVITTRAIISGSDPITFISLDDEGDWVALGDTEPADEDFDVLSVEEILLLDPSISDAPDLQPGQCAARDTAQSPWEIEED